MNNSEVKSVQGALVSTIRKSKDFNPDTQVAPACILWTDKDRQWEAVVSNLQGALPELFVLGEYDLQNRTGPAIWLKCVIANTLDEIEIPEDLTPIIYLPGISRAELRAIELCPDYIKPLAELQYRGVLWTQHNGKDWTVNAFLTSGSYGLGLDVAKDKSTQEALLRALAEVLSSDVKQLDNKRLEASDFNQLLTCDPIRDLLTWMNSPKDTVKHWSAGRWQALCIEAKNNFDVDIENDGEFAAAEKLCACEGAWKNVWQRYFDSPDVYPLLVTLLERVPLLDMLADPATYPQANMQDEENLMAALIKLATDNTNAVRDELLSLDNTHGFRRDTLWAKLGKAPWAKLLAPLADVAKRSQNSIAGLSPREIGERYSREGWLTDAAAMRAIAWCENKQQLGVIENILAIIYTPWLADLNERFQQHVKQKGYPGDDGVSEAVAEYQVGGELVFFVDGLRLDVAHQLHELLINNGLKPALTTQWSALPSVTATAKAAVSPIHSLLTGVANEKDFEPSVKDEGTLSHDRFKRVLAKQGWQHLAEDETGDANGNAWVACGDIDKEGHKSELKLPCRIPLILESIVERIIELQQVGWKKIRIVTDHGWLLVPGKMPKYDLPVQAVDSRWGRCAQLKQNVDVEGLTLGWYWNANVPIHYPHGIHSFIAGRTYAHGGVSLQECLVPVITIEGNATVFVKASIKSVKWLGLNCKVEISSETDNLFTDLRTKLADSNTSLVKAKKLKDGKASLMILDDDNEGVSATVVVYDSDGNILAKQATTVGGDE
ncbi:MAG: BREX-1 system phosphatase PglZ type B [Methylococcales bacterium]